MKKLTLNQAWTLCLKQWKWIIEQLDAGSKDVGNLKLRWMKKSRYINVNSACFFCHYHVQEHKKKRSNKECGYCPGRLVSRRFDCMHSSYDYKDKPRAFYRKLLALDKKRRVKK